MAEHPIVMAATAGLVLVGLVLAIARRRRWETVPSMPLPVVVTEREKAPRFPSRLALQAMARQQRVGSATWIAQATKLQLHLALKAKGLVA